ncbi:MAG: resolvase-like serine recombinase [Deltaproteobacteria bacterium]|nr:resolvase-like serine recombinase [Deltaproteobacteria bacterium]
MKGKFISYLRVSTEKQGISGLGLEAQRKAIEDYLNGGRWELIKEFVEVESGKRTDNRPTLRKALETCKRTGAKLLIAKLDRLSRNVAFIANLLESGVEFVACDFPSANKLTIHILSAMAEYEREMISKRTKEALKAAKDRGVKLGSPKGLTSEARKNGRALSLVVRQAKADEYAKRVHPIIKSYQSEGLSLHAIARKLTEDRELTPRGKETWTPTTVRNVLLRLKQV